MLVVNRGFQLFESTHEHKGLGPQQGFLEGLMDSEELNEKGTQKRKEKTRKISQISWITSRISYAGKVKMRKIS